MTQEDKVLQKLQNWAQSEHNVRAMILTSSRVDPNAQIDKLSDYDIELYVKDIEPFMNDDWLSILGDVMVRWPLQPMSTFDTNWITRLIQFTNKVRIDFQITAQKQKKPIRYDSGYQVLIDKNGIEKFIAKPTYKEHLIKKPTEEEFMILVNDFFWDATYVPKNLWRKDLFYAKYMFDRVLRFEYFERITEWYIAAQHDWAISTNKHGRYFQKYLSEKEWQEITQTFADSDFENNWNAFFKMLSVFSRYAKAIAQKLDYPYPENVAREVIKYCYEIKELR
jgi:aminoglycoside 6-adenylyltransferase